MRTSWVTSVASPLRSVSFRVQVPTRRGSCSASPGAGAGSVTTEAPSRVNDSPISRAGAAAAKTTATSMTRPEEHTSELQSLMRISYAVFCLKKKKQTKTNIAKLDTIKHPINRLSEKECRDEYTYLHRKSKKVCRSDKR